MLPIPVPIIKTKRLYIPVVYVVATLVLCHFFVTAFVGQSISVPQVLQNNTAFTINPANTQLPKGKKKPAGFRVHRSLPKSNSKEKNVSRGSDTTKIRISDQDKRIDMEKPKIHKFTEDPECTNFTIGFARQSTFQPRALVSFPGSGNSWLRHLIESSTGFFTGSIYNDKILFKGGFLGETRAPNDGTTIVQKTHHFSTISSSKEKLQAYVKLSELIFGYRGILLIRNPYDALLSFWNLRTTRTHMGHVSETSYSTMAWKMFVEKGVKSWADLIMDWVEKSVDLHVVQYEELKEHTEIELLRILQYLQQPIDPTRIKCTIRHAEGSFHRNHNKFGDKFHNKVIPTDSPYRDITDISGNLTLDLIVQNNIKKLNTFFLEYDFPLQLHYKLHD